MVHVVACELNWLCMVECGCMKLCVGSHNYVHAWLCMVVYMVVSGACSCMWLYIVEISWVWLSIALCGFVWLGVSNSAWLWVVLCGHTWLCLVFDGACGCMWLYIVEDN